MVKSVVIGIAAMLGIAAMTIAAAFSGSANLHTNFVGAGSYDNSEAVNAAIVGSTVQNVTLSPSDSVTDSPGELQVDTAIGWTKTTLPNSTMFTLAQPNSANVIVAPNGATVTLNRNVHLRATRYFVGPVEHFLVQIEGTEGVTTFSGTLSD